MPPQSACPCEDVRQDVGAVLHTNPTKGQESGTVTNRPQREGKTSPQQGANDYEDLAGAGGKWRGGTPATVWGEDLARAQITLWIYFSSA